MRKGGRGFATLSHAAKEGAEPMVIAGIAHVQVAIPPGGEDAARAFYRDLLGLEEIEKPASLGGRGGAWFACGPQQLHCGVEAEIAITRRHAALLTDDLEALRRILGEAGIPIEEQPVVPGWRRFHAIDPFGNRLEFQQPDET